MQKDDFCEIEGFQTMEKMISKSSSRSNHDGVSFGVNSDEHVQFIGLTSYLIINLTVSWKNLPSDFHFTRHHKIL